MSVLGDRQRGAAPAPAVSRFAAALAGARARRKITISSLGLTAWLTLAGHAATQEIEGATFKRMAELGLELGPLTSATYEAERAVRTLAVVVFEDESLTVPLGSLEEWQRVDLDTLNLLWQEYGDLREERDPVAAPLPREERELIEAAIQKKSAPLLRSFGARRLATWLLSTADLPATSPIPSYSSSASSPES